MKLKCSNRTRMCNYCGTEFKYSSKHNNRNKHFFCSKECAWEFKIKKVTVHCDWCDKKFLKKRSDIARTKHNFCSPRCACDFKRWTGLTGKNPKVDGVEVHRKIMEDLLDRPLTSDEEVHHIDFNHHNNKIENLIVLSKSEHSKIHAAGKERDNFGRFIKKK